MTTRAPFRRLAAAFFGGIVLVSASLASAETPPGSWDKVKDPSLEETYRAHLFVTQKLASQPSDDDPFDASRLRPFVLDQVLGALRAAHAATSTDLRLRSDLIQVLRLRETTLGEKHTAELLPMTQALCANELGTDAQRAGACFTLALIHAQAERTDEEIATYASVLRFETDPLQRAIIVMNRAEGYMRLGQLHEAMDGYREVIATLSPMGLSGDTLPSAYWGLAVALDRYRDPQGAVQAATWATTSDPSLFLVRPGNGRGENPNVFFVPDYDAHWYRAVGFRALALGSGISPIMVAGYFALSQTEYARYIEAAEAANDTM
ncbi:hypothetical protein BH09MYX1_BH09MYX1_10560 [soil metagenome]